MSFTNVVTDYRVAQIRAVFSIPSKIAQQLFDPARPAPPSHLAYVEWFSPFADAPENDTGMYKISRSFERNGSRECSVIPVDSIERSVHLYPRYARNRAQTESWNSFDALEKCMNYSVNDLLDKHSYRYIFYPGAL
jgi:hypothetical protein